MSDIQRCVKCTWDRAKLVNMCSHHQEIATLTERLAAAEAHEQQTHKRLGAILGTDTSLEEAAKRMAERLAAAEAAALFYARYYDGPAEALLGEEDRRAFMWVETNCSKSSKSSGGE